MTVTDSMHYMALEVMDQPLEFEDHKNRLHDAFMSMKLAQRKQRVKTDLDIEELHYTMV
jgi:hypothetical protein